MGGQKSIWSYIRGHKFNRLLFKNFAYVFILVTVPLLLVLSLNYNRFSDVVGKRVMDMNEELLQQSAVVTDNIMVGLLDSLNEISQHSSVMEIVQLEETDTAYNEKVKQVIQLVDQQSHSSKLIISSCLFVNQMAGYVQFTTVNPFVLGQLLECLDLLSADIQKKSIISCDMWKYIHPNIIKASQKLYADGHYANAAEDAFIEINDRVKKLYKKLNPTSSKIPDGDAAMTTVFSPNNPMLKVCDISTDTGMNEQKGLMFMLQGAMSALRNPKAHSNITISKDDAMRRIMYASMLMYKIDEAVNYSNVSERTEND